MVESTDTPHYGPLNIRAHDQYKRDVGAAFAEYISTTKPELAPEEVLCVLRAGNLAPLAAYSPEAHHSPADSKLDESIRSAYGTLSRADSRFASLEYTGAEFDALVNTDASFRALVYRADDPHFLVCNRKHAPPPGPAPETAPVDITGKGLLRRPFLSLAFKCSWARTAAAWVADDAAYRRTMVREHGITPPPLPDNTPDERGIIWRKTTLPNGLTQFTASSAPTIQYLTDNGPVDSGGVYSQFPAPPPPQHPPLVQPHP